MLQSLALLFFLCLVTASAKSRIGEYYLGLGYSIADSTSNDKEADFLRLTAHAPNGPDSDIGIYLDYGTMEQNGSDASSWNLGVDYLAHFNGIGGRVARLIPYLGAGVGYLDDERPIRLGKDGFTWSLLLGSEIQLTNSLSIHLAGRYFGLWSEFGENELTADAAITWWFDAVHGVSFEYQHAFEAELNYFTLKYLYSWQ